MIEGGFILFVQDPFLLIKNDYNLNHRKGIKNFFLKYFLTHPFPYDHVHNSNSNVVILSKFRYNFVDTKNKNIKLLIIKKSMETL